MCQGPGGGGLWCIRRTEEGPAQLSRGEHSFHKQVLEGDAHTDCICSYRKPLCSHRAPGSVGGSFSEGSGGPRVMTVKQPSVQALSRVLHEPHLPAPPSSPL